ncbi:MAG TPA: ANTAR domain-containing protein [Terriglobales bacterium]|nr:ANTAR domain-containing protein [Terriglobales bacterium]
MASPAEWHPPTRNPKLSTCGPDEIDDHSALSVLHRLAIRISQSPRLETAVNLVAEVVPCDSCFIYVLEGSELVLRASRNPHPGVVERLKLKIGEGIPGGTLDHQGCTMVPSGAGFDRQFGLFNKSLEDRYEAFLSVPLVRQGKLIGVINVQNRNLYEFSEREIALLSAVGHFVGAEIEIARLEKQNLELSKKLEMRTLVERAKGILQTDLRITEQEAYQKLQRQSQEMRRSMKEIAEAVLLSHSLRNQGQS